MNYWKECVSEALESAGLSATPEQLEAIADDVRSGHEMYAESQGHLCIPNPLATENERLVRELKAERELVFNKANGSKWYPEAALTPAPPQAKENTQ